jgi:glycolate oxidase iron-sulfur subunit
VFPLPMFDSKNPPAPNLIDQCVHCGFCLPTCPTYVLWGEEMDSPRGRILLMKLGHEGTAGLTETSVRHFDQCLGCMACVTACPSGVAYDQLIESTRQQVERRYPRAPQDRLFRALLFALFPYPNRLRLIAPALWLYQRSGLAGTVRRGLGALSQRVGQADGGPLGRGLRRVFGPRLPARLAALESMAPPLTWRGLRRRLPVRTPAQGPQRARVGLLAGCVQRVFFSDVNAASVRVLAAEGCEVLVPPQGCCGALALHAGREEDAKAHARALLDAFAATDFDYLAVNAAGCGSTLKEYGHLLRDDPEYAARAAAFAARVRDISEVLDTLGPVARRAPLRATVAYHDACHLAHAQGVRRPPRNVLRSIPGLDLVPIPESEICCGSAGIYNLVEPEPAAELGERKARHIIGTGARLVATANPGCTLQIRAAAQRLGHPLRVVHPVQILDLAIRRGNQGR